MRNNAGSGKTQRQGARVAAYRRGLRLPAHPSRLIGREREVATSREELLREDVRLLTLTGPPGVGKTRLALDVAAGLESVFEHGVAFVDLSPITAPDLVIPTIARTVGAGEAGDEPILGTLTRAVADHSVLLVLDNFEHVLDAASEVAELLAGCPRLKVLVTSRERLHLSWEREFPVQPLELPDRRVLSSPETLQTCPPVALFIERVRAIKPDFILNRENARAVAEICTQLDGLPLPIELAAASIKLLPPTAMALHLANRLDLLDRGPRDVPARHRTLRAAVGWSYGLLRPREQAMFRRLAIFAGGFAAEAATAVYDAPDPGQAEIDVLEVLASLVDKNLIREMETVEGAIRFGMLATIREFGLEAMAAEGELEEARQRHAAYFLALAEQAELHFQSGERQTRLKSLEREQNNLRAALQFLAERNQWEAVLRLTGAIGLFWLELGFYGEGRGWLEEAVRKGTDAPAPLRAKALVAAGDLAGRQGSFEDAQRLYEQSLAALQNSGDKIRAARAHFGLGRVALVRSDWGPARSHYEHSLTLSEAAGDEVGIARALIPLAYLARLLGDRARGHRLLEQSQAICQRIGATWLNPGFLFTRAEWLAEQDDVDAAEQAFEEARALYESLGSKRDLAMTCNALGNLASRKGDYGAAQVAHEKALALAREIGAKWQTASALSGLAYVALNHGDVATARDLYEESLALRRNMGHKGALPDALNDLGCAVLHQGDCERATVILEDALTLSRSMGDERAAARALTALATTARVRGDRTRAVALLRESLTLWWKLGGSSGTAECLERLASVDGWREDLRLPARLLGAAEALREATRTPMPPIDRLHFEETLSTLRSRLGRRALAAAWAQGRTTPVAEVVEQVLAISPTPLQTAGAEKPRAPDALAPLSAREQEVASLITSGFSNRQIATALVITEGTVQNHVQHILNKLGFHTRSQIAVWAAIRGARTK